jgi:hypothetical protein
MSQRQEKILQWLNSEKAKDEKELQREKDVLIRKIKKLKKEDLFPQPKKLTLWQKIKILILGN